MVSKAEIVEANIVYGRLQEAASYPPYGEGNQRTPRAEFTNLYCPVSPAEAAESMKEAANAYPREVDERAGAA